MPTAPTDLPCDRCRAEALEAAVDLVLGDVGYRLHHGEALTVPGIVAENVPPGMVGIDPADEWERERYAAAIRRTVEGRFPELAGGPT
jgi:hypothetical protein